MAAHARNQLYAAFITQLGAIGSVYESRAQALRADQLPAIGVEWTSDEVQYLAGDSDSPSGRPQSRTLAIAATVVGNDWATVDAIALAIERVVASGLGREWRLLRSQSGVDPSGERVRFAVQITIEVDYWVREATPDVSE